MKTPNYFSQDKVALGTYVILFGSNYFHKTCNVASYKIIDAKVKDYVTLIQ
jgi:hypothetical protein